MGLGHGRRVVRGGSEWGGAGPCLRRGDDGRRNVASAGRVPKEGRYCYRPCLRRRRKEGCGRRRTGGAGLWRWRPAREPARGRQRSNGAEARLRRWRGRKVQCSIDSQEPGGLAVSRGGQGHCLRGMWRRRPRGHRGGRCHGRGGRPGRDRCREWSLRGRHFSRRHGGTKGPGPQRGSSSGRWRGARRNKRRRGEQAERRSRSGRPRGARWHQGSRGRRGAERSRQSARAGRRRRRGRRAGGRGCMRGACAYRKRGQRALCDVRDKDRALSSIPAQGRIRDPHARDGLQGVAVIDVTRVEPRVEREVETRGGRDAKVIQ